MPNSGWIYVLANASSPNLVKVGKTTRDPHDRAAELSNATGVPSAFVVVYSRYFADVDAAERHAHAKLDLMDTRHSSNREFFRISSDNAIELLDAIPASVTLQQVATDRDYDGTFDTEPTEVPTDTTPRCGSQNTTNPATDVDSFLINKKTHDDPTKMYQKARRLLYGVGDQYQNPGKGLQYLRDALTLGSGDAAFELGYLYMHGLVVPEDRNEALQYLELGTRLNTLACYHGIAMLFFENWIADPEESGDIPDADKAWKHFFDGWSSQPSVHDLCCAAANAGAQYIAMNRAAEREPVVYSIMKVKRQEILWWAEANRERAADVEPEWVRLVLASKHLRDLCADVADSDVDFEDVLDGNGDRSSHEWTCETLWTDVEQWIERELFDGQ